MLHWKMPKVERREVTPRRLQAANRHLAKERERYALFADQLVQPTAADRVANYDAGFLSWYSDRRKDRAKNWLRARASLARLPDEQRRAVISCWRRCTYPLDPEYLLSLIHNIETGKFDPVAHEADLERLRKLGAAARQRQEVT